MVVFGICNCKDFVLPKSNLEYRRPIFEQNKARDLKNIGELQSKSWNVVIIWECELKTATDRKVKNGTPYTRTEIAKAVIIRYSFYFCMKLSCIFIRAVKIIISLTNTCLSVIDSSSADTEFSTDFGLYHSVHIAVQNGEFQSG